MIIERLEQFPSMVYYCFGHEVAPTTGTPHVHLYFVVKTPTRFTTVRNRFEGAHIEVCRGNSEQNRAYVLKECGEDGDFTEWGELPNEQQGHPRYMDELFELICAGKSDFEIFKTNAAYINHAAQIGRVRDAVQQEAARTKMRTVSVYYIQAVESAATKYVMERYGMENVYRASAEHPFDYYAGQSVLYFPGFSGTIQLTDMLGYCSGYPVQLSARYNNRWAAFETLILAASKGLEEQYRNEQYDNHESWSEFLRTVKAVITFDGDGRPVEQPVSEYLSGKQRASFASVGGSANSPFGAAVNGREGAAG